MLLEGWLWRQAEQKERRKRAESVAAYFVAHLLNVSGKTIKGKITTADLMKPLEDKPQRDTKSDKEYLREQFPEAFRNEGGE